MIKNIASQIIHDGYGLTISDTLLTYLRNLNDTFEYSRYDFELPEEAYPIYEQLVKSFQVAGWKRFKVVRVKSWNYCGRWYYKVYKDQDNYFELERICIRYYH